eukprot:scaffold916_cov60-Phaeocystis_antarctica.AAC.1
MRRRRKRGRRMRGRACGHGGVRPRGEQPVAPAGCCRARPRRKAWEVELIEHQRAVQRVAAFASLLEGVCGYRGYRSSVVVRPIAPDGKRELGALDVFEVDEQRLLLLVGVEAGHAVRVVRVSAIHVRPHGYTVIRAGVCELLDGSGLRI